MSPRIRTASPPPSRCHGKNSYTKTIGAIQAVELSDDEKQKILAGNIIRLLRLDS